MSYDPATGRALKPQVLTLKPTVQQHAQSSTRPMSNQPAQARAQESYFKSNELHPLDDSGNTKNYRPLLDWMGFERNVKYSDPATFEKCVNELAEKVFISPKDEQANPKIPSAEYRALLVLLEMIWLRIYQDQKILLEFKDARGSIKAMQQLLQMPFEKKITSSRLEELLAISDTVTWIMRGCEDFIEEMQAENVLDTLNSLIRTIN
eukprot:GEMP01051980.1.p1 GENE.GEMP01051980.1~~GEMP01051980.1.p1  ORF type:complete len:207 (+),score=39.06 GEMP01051980.1:203-823(+)